MDEASNQEMLFDLIKSHNNSLTFSSSSFCVINRLSLIENAMKNYINTLREYQSTEMLIDIKYKTLNKEIDDLVSNLKKEIGDKLSMLVNEIEYQNNSVFGRAMRNRDDIKSILQDNIELNNQIAFLNYKIIKMEKELHLPHMR